MWYYLLVIPLFIGTTFAYAQEFTEYGFKIETVAEGLDVPWSIAFAPDGRIFVTERVGKLRVIEDGLLRDEPVTILNVGHVEGGLLGIALDPNFAENHYVYLYYTYSELLSTYNRVSRFIEKDNKLSEETILIDKIPGAAIHDGGRIRFGPDSKLYITTGDAANANLAQDINSLAGKILRINPDGTIPSDNPFPNSPVYSYGHRNPQGIDWDPKTGKLVVSEHGPSGERGFAHDEINVIEAGKNYGWPNVVGDESDPKFINPLFHTGQTVWAPSGASFYNSDKIPFLSGKFLVATLRGTHLHVFELDLAENKIVAHNGILSGEFGRLRDIVQDSNGYLYLLTSNRDGRGTPLPNDDRVLKIVPLDMTATPSSELDIRWYNSKTLKFHPPLKLLKNGIDEAAVVCNKPLIKLYKPQTDIPVCVKITTSEKLVERGWHVTSHSRQN
ncbi:MAG: PQQ-dependent sugar dehydrogenase [Candidatus Nitrosotenuis sp.]